MSPPHAEGRGRIVPGEEPPLRWWVLGALLVLGGFLLFYRLGERDLWESGETRYALKALMMRETGDWIVPVLKGQAWLNKPPLLMWLINLFGLLRGGIDGWAARLPAALAGLGTVLVIYWWGLRIRGPIFGGIAGFILLTSTLFLMRARFNDPEPLLAFLITLALFAFYAGYHSWFSNKTWWVMYVAMGLATTTKGPMGFVLPGLVILTYLVSRRDLSAIGRMQVGTGMLLFAGVTLPWFLAVFLIFGKSIHLPLYGEILQTVLGTGGRRDPWYFYIGGLLYASFPWSLFLPGLFLVWRHYSPRDRGAAEGLHFATLWVGVIFVVLSLTSKKRVYYGLHLLPPVALLLAYVWQYFSEERFEDRERLRRVTGHLFTGLGLITLVLAAGVVSGVVLPPVASREFTVTPSTIFALTMVPLGLGGAALLLRERRYGWTFAAFGVAVFWGQLLALQYIFPALYQGSNARAIAETLKRYVKPGAEVRMVDYYSHAISFHFGRDIPPAGHHRLDPLVAGDRPVYLLAEEQGGRVVLDKHDFHIILCREFYHAVEKTILLLLTNWDCDTRDGGGG